MFVSIRVRYTMADLEGACSFNFGPEVGEICEHAQMFRITYVYFKST